MQDSNVNINLNVEGNAEQKLDKATKKLGAFATMLGVTEKNFDSTKSYSENMNKAAKAASDAEKAERKRAAAVDENAAATNRASNAQKNWFAHITRTTIQSALVNKAFLTVADSIGKAAKQTDLIETFPAAMGAMGISTNVASDALNKLRVYVQNVGGDLAAATNAVSRFAQVNKDVKASTAVYAGVNNALMAGGTSAETQASALEQLIQAYSRGKFEGEEWRSVNTAMSLAMAKTAEALGYMNTSSLQKAMTDGAVSMNQFITELTKISTEAGPIADQAMLKMSGIEFAQVAMQNTLVNGLNEIYAAVGRQNIVAFFTFLTDVIRVLFTWIVALINAFRGLIGFITGQKLAPITGDTQEALENSAGSAGKIGKNLDDAGKSAKKLHNQLASFDKMNVLQEPSSGNSGKKKKGGAGGNGGFDPGQAAALDGIFGKMSGKLKEASLWAKIFAGIISALALNGLIKKLFGVNPLGGLIRGLSSAAKGMFTTGESSKKLAKNLGDAEKKGGGLGTVFKKIAANPLVLVAVVLAAIIIALVRLYNTNEDFKKGFDETWGSFLNIVKEVGSWLGGVLLGALQTIGNVLGTVFSPLGDVLKKFGEWMGLRPQMESFGNVIGIIAAALSVSLVTAIVLAAGKFTVLQIKGVLAAGKVAAAWTLEKLKIVASVAKTAIIAGGHFAGIVIKAAIAAGQTALSWTINTAKIIGQFVLMGVQYGIQVAAMAAATMVSAIKMAAAWVIGLGPIALIVAAVVLLAALIIANWDTICKALQDAWNWIAGVFGAVGQWFMDNVIKPVGDFFGGLWNTIAGIFGKVGSWFGQVFQNAWNGIKNIWGGVAGFFGGVWNGIVGIFGSVGSWFGQKFQDGWNAIKNIFSGVGGFFKGVWDTIVGIFGKVGTSIGNAIGGAVKGVVNTILGFAEGTINGFIKAINVAIGIINKIPGVHLGELGLLHIPRLATGGVIDQPTVAMVGESGPEAVMPLENNTQWIDKLASKLNTGNSRSSDNGLEVTNKQDQKPVHITINVSGVFATSNAEKRKVAEEIANQLKGIYKAKGVTGVL